MAKERDPAAIRIGQRIRQAREMGGYETQAALSAELAAHQWSRGRLSNYETGFSIPHPDDVQLLAELTDTSACWIMFGVGPISQARTTQAIRHQNLTYIVRTARSDSTLSDLHAKLHLKPGTLQEYVDNPFQHIHDRMARSLERAIRQKKGWMDEQHIELDPMYMQFPDELRQLLTLYSGLPAKERGLLLKMAQAIDVSAREHD